MRACLLEVFLAFNLCLSPLLFSSGLWPDGSDGTDINAVGRTNDKSLLVTGDDFGKVHLLTYPCSQFRVSTANSSLPDVKVVDGVRRQIRLCDKHHRKFKVSSACVPFQAPGHIYGGHSSHVTNVSFLYDDSYLVSTGGKDMSVMQWRIV